MNPSQTPDRIWVHVCFRPQDCLIITKSRSHATRESVFHRRCIQDLEKLFHDQPQHRIEQRVELLGVGIPVCNRVFFWCWTPTRTGDFIVVDIYPQIITLLFTSSEKELRRNVQDLVNVPTVWDLHIVVVWPGPLKLTLHTTLQFPGASWTVTHLTSLHFPETSLTRNVFIHILRIRCWGFEVLPNTDSESSCGFFRTSEASEPEDEGCFWFSTILKTKQVDLGFATASTSVRLPFLNSLQHGVCLSIERIWLREKK